MSKPYTVLNAMPAEAFLNPDNFKTDYDPMHEGTEYPRQQYDKGLKTSQEAIEVGVSANGTWFASMKDGSYLTSYEGIGYHASTKELLQGLLDGGARVVIHRYIEGEGYKSFVIKEGI